MQDQDNIDILGGVQDIDLSGVDTSYPVLKAGTYQFLVSDVREEPNKARTGKNLVIKFRLNQTALTIEDVEVQPGLALTHNISMVQTQKYDPRRNLAVFQEATLGRKENLMPLDKYVGAEVMISVKVTHDDQYGTRNEVQRLLKKA